MAARIRLGRVGTFNIGAETALHGGNTMNTFSKEVILVTGASSGIGEAIALAFAVAGAKVYGTARTEEALAEVRARHPQVNWVRLDVRDGIAARGAVEGVVKHAGRLDVLVNNAGVARPGPLQGTRAEDVALQFETNVYGLTYVTQAALPALQEAKGSIVNIGSAAGHKPTPGLSLYAASKAAVESLTISWALELAPHRVRVNAIAPGPTETPVFGKFGLPPDMLAGMKEGIVKSLPLGRIAQPAEIARWVVALADPSVTWMTGQVLSVDGGMSLT
jgi:NAD(P)-dependent dehydrogenase (short-subunit alcohol dehydrogenase family)